MVQHCPAYVHQNMEEGSALPSYHGSFSSSNMVPPLMLAKTANIMSMPSSSVAEQEDELSKMAVQEVQETVSEEIFTSYDALALPKSFNAMKHPGCIVEAGSLAAQTLPDATYNLASSIPQEAIAEGKLSDLQLEGILFACQRHLQILPNGNRAGFFIGDGAGVGKGRQIAGIILDNFARGRSKSIWFSISSDLKIDAQRDLNDIGCFIKVIDGCQELDRETKIFGLPKDFTEGVVFCTYATLVSSVQKGINNIKQSRLKQLIDWCGGTEFDGCLIFDECHKAKHFLPGNEKSSTKVAMAVIELQRILPKARVLYCSATGVTDVKNMAYMERLGLWGYGTAFKDFNIFLDNITRRGLGTLEMLAMDMKSAGMYISRGLSYQQTEFRTVDANLTEVQVQVWDQAVHVWNELKRSITIASDRTKVLKPRLWTQFWASHQRFFKQLCISMKVPKIVEAAKQALQDGYCVVIGLQTTGEASLMQEMTEKNGNITKFISLCGEILKRFILQYFPTDIQLNPNESKEDPWSIKAKDMLLGFVDKITLPNSPLDDIIDQLGGPNNVAEMTGRSGRIVRLQPGATPQYQNRASAAGNVDSLNVQERNSFMAGTKLVAIISDAASTGISLHADTRAANQRRRVHLTIELPWSADKAVQQLGRSHRSNQTSGPIYELMTTNLGGEKRFASAVSKRLQSLGALTKGDRRAATAADLSQFNFDSTYGRMSLKTMYTSIAQQSLPSGVFFSDIIEGAQTGKSYTLEEFQKIMRECLKKMDVIDTSVLGTNVKQNEVHNVTKFLNRILGLSVEKQNLIFSYFFESMKSLIRIAKRDGRYNEGVADVKGNSIKLLAEPVIVFSNAQNSTNVTKHVTLSIDRGINWNKAMELYGNHCGKFDGFYCSKKSQKGKKLYLLATEKENVSNVYIIYRPNTGISPFEETRSDLLHKYDKIEPPQAEEGWNEQFVRTEHGCIHGASCKLRPKCSVGRRITHLHLLCGGIISLLSVLEMTVHRCADALGLTRENKTLRVVRVELDNGQRLIGLKYPEPLICEASKLLSKPEANDDLQNKVAAEKESPVIPTLKAKATTPPVTLKKFFKVEKKEEAGSALELTVMPKGDDVIEPVGESRKASEVKGVKKGLSNTNEIGNINYSHLKKTASFPSMNSRNQKSKTLKRTASSIETKEGANKRSKQSNLKDCFFKKQNTKSQQAKCPICGKDFNESGMDNDQINEHIDGCLIE